VCETVNGAIITDVESNGRQSSRRTNASRARQAAITRAHEYGSNLARRTRIHEFSETQAVTDGSFCGRLRRERERRHIALSSISANTKIRVGLFEALERGDVSRWPAGIYRRAIIRAYAVAVGLDPDETAREFLEEFPDADEPVPAHAAHAANARPAVRGSRETVLRLTLAEDRSPFEAGQLLQRMRDRWAAVAIDACVVLAIATSVFVACQVFWLPLAVAMLGYYLGGILLLGNSPGVCLRASGGRGSGGPGGGGSGESSFLITLKSSIAKSTVEWLARFKRPAAAPPPGSLRPIR
jgi:hypothetical protein